MLTERMISSFLTLADTLNYTEAARRLYLSHQALSKQIARLEEELGYPLFARSTRSVALTEVGELFRGFFRGESERYAAVCLEAERLSRIQANDLRVGFPPGIQPPSFFSGLARSVRESGEDPHIRLEWHDVDALTKLFQQDALDVVFSLDDSGLEVSPDAGRVKVEPCRLVLAAARDHPGWQGEGLSGFSGATFFYEQESTPESTNAMRQTVVQVLREAGVANPVIELVPNTQSRQAAVELGAGCCLSVDLETMCSNPLVRTWLLDRPPSYLSCYWRRESRKPAVREFIRKFTQWLEEERSGKLL